MWPWTRDEVELPASLQEFYSQNDPLQKVLTDAQRSAHVHKVLALKSGAYDHTLEAHKRHENTRNAAAINCAELHNAVVECYRGWSFLRGNECLAEIARAAKCLETQQRALRSLRYESCYSTAQCRQIKAAVDALFTDNFGQLGDRMDAASERQFDQDIDHVFELVWK